MRLERELEDRMKAGFIPAVEVSCIGKSASNSPSWNVFSCPYFRSIPKRGGIGESRNLMLRSYGCRYELHLRLLALQEQNLYTSFVCEGKGTVLQHTIGLYSFVPSCFRDTRDVPGIVVQPGMQCQLTQGWTIDARCGLKQSDCKFN